MANMGYCRFENTLSDLRDCLNHLDDEVESREAVNLFGLLPDPINEGG